MNDSETAAKDAPLPAPLHIIQAAASPQDAPRVADHGGSHSWVVSEGEGQPVHDHLSGRQGTRFPEGPAEPSGHSDRDAESISQSALKLYEQQLAAVEGWEGGGLALPIVHMLRDGLDRDPETDCQDIDTTTGQLLKPIKHVKVRKEVDVSPSNDRNSPGWRRWNMSANLHIERERKARAEAREQQARRKAEVEAKTAGQSQIPEEEPWPDAHCTLRPAVPSDFEAIADIMNEEKEEPASPILRPLHIRPVDIEAIYDTCRENSRPFIVAVSNPKNFLDRSRWPKGADEDYEDYIKFKMSQPSQPPTVLGFAFIADWREGFLGGVCAGSRFTGKIKLVVRPSHRRKLVGSALLDRVLLCAAIYHRSLVDYQWECFESKKVYEDPPALNRRKYAKVYVETFFTGEDDPRIAWVTRMLEKFDFKRVACFKESVKKGSFGGQWLDMAVWELQTREVSDPDLADT
ncbi:hypothetical protein ACJ41O_003948 [Fusarium nematophilum]